MRRIGIISDTHGTWDKRYEEYFASCDEIWHAGDIGSTLVADRFEALKPFRAVCGNCDGGDLRRRYPLLLRFRCEAADIFLTHIGGYPGHYDVRVRQQLLSSPPSLFICGHSHILKVVYDECLSLLHINPGAAGTTGWQVERTFVRFTVAGATFKDLEVVSLGKNCVPL